MKLQHRALLAGLAIAALAPSAGAGVYKWVDKDGRVHYGDRPSVSEAAQADQLDRSGLPPALEQRLRSLDPDFVITRISGSLEVAWVCGEYRREALEDGGQPQFPLALERARLGKVRDRYGSYGNYGDDDQYDHRGRKKNSGKCPRRDPRAETDRQRRLYELRFDPEVVDAYRAAKP